MSRKNNTATPGSCGWVLDSKNAENVLTIFRSLATSRGVPLLIVTHDQDFADRTGRIITMEDGRII